MLYGPFLDTILLESVDINASTLDISALAAVQTCWALSLRLSIDRSYAATRRRARRIALKYTSA